GFPCSLARLSGVVGAVSGRGESRCDGGLRSGQDVLRGQALGAQSTMIGRAFLYALGAAGQAGVERALELIQNELSVTMGLCGIRTVDEISRDILLNPNCFADYFES